MSFKIKILKEIELMLKELNSALRKVGFCMNFNKTKKLNKDSPYIKIDESNIENVNEFVYLGHKNKLGKENKTLEITCRIELS